MHAVILAAGCGRRMNGIVSHKSLLRIGDRTILDRLIDELVDLPVDALTVVTGHRAPEVTSAARKRAGELPLQFVHNERYATTNNVVSLALALERIDVDEEILLMEGDLVLSGGLLDRVCAGERGRNVALVGRFHSRMDGTVVTVRDGIVDRMFPPGAPRAPFRDLDTFKTVNVYRFSPELRRSTLDHLVKRYAGRVDPGAYYEAVLATVPQLASLKLEVEVVNGVDWAEIDDPIDLAGARFRFAPEERADLLDRARGGIWDFELLDFSFMQNAYFPTPGMLGAMRDALPRLVAGYGSTQSVIDEKLAWLVGCDPDRILALHGATQAYPLLRRMWPSQTIAIPEPTFGEYSRVFPEARRYRDAPGVDLDELDRLAGEVKVLVIVNPNNPTGTTLPTAEVHALAARHAETIVLVDESFVEFSEETPLVQLLQEAPLPNVVVLSSLSKSLGVPGVRLGYVFCCDQAFIATIGQELPIWNLSAIAEHLLGLVLKRRGELQSSLQRTKLDREAFRRDLLEVSGVRTVYPSGGNFVLVELDGAADTAAVLRRRLLANELIEVKDVTQRFADGVPRLRLAVRRPSDHQRLLAALVRCLDVTSDLATP